MRYWHVEANFWRSFLDGLYLPNRPADGLIQYRKMCKTICQPLGDPQASNLLCDPMLQEQMLFPKLLLQGVRLVIQLPQEVLDLLFKALQLRIGGLWISPSLEIIESLVVEFLA